MFKLMIDFNKSIWHRIGFSILATVIGFIALVLALYFYYISVPLFIIGIIVYIVHKNLWERYDEYN